MLAIIQAGGAGTRLKSITGDLPKPMVPLDGKPILEWQINSLKRAGVRSFIIVKGKNGETISRYFGDGKAFDVKIECIEEKEPLGTAGVLALLHDKIDDDLFLLWGFNARYRLAKIASLPQGKGNSHYCFRPSKFTPLRFRHLKDEQRRPNSRYRFKNNVRDYYYENLTNAGVYICSKEVASFVKEPTKIDFEKVVLSHFVEERKAYAYRSSEYVKDCGTPERYFDVETI